MRLVILALFCLATCGVAQAEFVVKYVIDGHIIAPPCSGRCADPGSDAWCVDMDGDPSSLEMVVAGEDAASSYVRWRKVGICRIATGETQWFSQAQAGDYPMLNGFGFLVAPMFRDADADGLPDVFVPTVLSNVAKTVVIGWDSSADAHQPGTDGLTSGLQQSRPNPARGSLSIDFELPARARVDLRVYDAGGRLVRILEDRELGAGIHTVTWDGCDDRGAPASAGTYFYSLEAEGRKQTGRLVLAG